MSASVPTFAKVAKVGHPPFAKDYRFAVYNLAQLLLRDGQLVRAECYAAEAYRQSMSQTSDADSDLRAAILKQWPNVTDTV